MQLAGRPVRSARALQPKDAEPRVQLLMDQIDYHARQIVDLVYGETHQHGAPERNLPDQPTGRQAVHSLTGRAEPTAEFGRDNP